MKLLPSQGYDFLWIFGGLHDFPTAKTDEKTGSQPCLGLVVVRLC